MLSRLQTYHNTTEPIAAFYESRGKLIRIDGQGTVEEITAKIFGALDALQQ